MKIDLTTLLKTFEGEQLFDATPVTDIYGQQVVNEVGKPVFERIAVTLRRVAQAVLLNPLPGDDTRSGEEKAALWVMLGDTREDTVEWTPSQVAILRDRIGKGYGVAVVGPAYDLLRE